MRPLRWMCGLALLVTAGVPARAQERTSGVVTGVVRERVNDRPVIGAVVTLTHPAGERSTRTDEQGTFVIPWDSPGTATLTVRRLGYEPYARTLRAGDDTPLEVRLVRLAILDTVRVRAARQAIYGVVAAARDMRPLSGAVVSVYGSSLGRTMSDSTGRFFHPVQSTGPHMVRATMVGYEPQVVSITVDRGTGAEIALLLDSAAGSRRNQLEGAYSDFRERLLRRGGASALVPRTELTVRGDRPLIQAAASARSFVLKTLRFSDEVCLFVDGVPRPGLTPNAIPLAQVEAVEVYSTLADRSGNLAERWPNGAPCGSTGLPRAQSMRGGVVVGQGQRTSDIVRWIVVWTRADQALPSR